MQILQLTSQLQTVFIDAVHSKISIILTASAILTCNAALSIINLIILNRYFKSASTNGNESLAIQSLCKPISRASQRTMKDLWSSSSYPSANNLMLFGGTPIKSQSLNLNSATKFEYLIGILRILLIETLKK